MANAGRYEALNHVNGEVAQGWTSDRNNNNSNRHNGAWVEEIVSADELSLISLEDGETEQTLSTIRYKKRVTFVADERLVSIRSISPRSSSPVYSELNSSEAVEAEHVEDDRSAVAEATTALACRAAARRNSRLIYNRLVATNSAKLSTICVDTQHQPRPPPQPAPTQGQQRCSSADVSSRPDSASSSFAVTKRRIDRYINATRPLTANSYRRKAAIAASTNPSRPHKPRQLIEINMKGLNNGSLLFRPVLAKSCPDLAKTVEVSTAGTNGRLAQPSDRWGRPTPTRTSTGQEKTKMYAWQMANGGSSVATPSIVPMYGSGVISGRPYSAT